SLVGGDDHGVRIVGRDPCLVVVVAAGRAAERDPCSAAIFRAGDRHVRYIYNVGVSRIDSDFLEVPASSPKLRVRGQLRPCRARIVGSVKPTLLDWSRGWSKFL